jgi:hypothetical protein
MSELAAQLDEARSRVAELEQRAAVATCAELGRHEWESTGGCACGCWEDACSVPVHHCTRCGECDYGCNEDASEVRRKCKERHS